jgi:hypothetical protein
MTCKKINFTVSSRIKENSAKTQKLLAYNFQQENINATYVTAGIYNLTVGRNMTVQLLGVAKVSIIDARSMFYFAVSIIGNLSILRQADPNTFLILISEFFCNGHGTWSTNFQKCLYEL